MADLTTTYMGLKLKNPVIAGSSNLTLDIRNIKAMEESGIGAIVYKSLFEEQANFESADLDEDLQIYNERHATLFPINSEMQHPSPKEFLIQLEKIRKNTSVPLIASINAIHEKTWVDYAKLIEATGVDALELNLCKIDALKINLYKLFKKSNDTEENIEKHKLNIIKSVRKAVKIPVAVKIGSFYSDLINFICEVDKTGINGLVLFNKLFEPEIDINEEKPLFSFNLSNKGDHRLPLRYAGLLYGNVSADICASSGIFDGDDAIKMLLAGSSSVQVVSTIYKNKISHIENIVGRIEDWMDNKGYKTIDDFRGKLSRNNYDDFKRSFCIFNRTTG